MRLKLILPVVKAEQYQKPEECPYGCGGKEFWIRQEVKKAVRDTQQDEVRVRRYECLQCHRTFRVYPQGGSRKQFSQRAIGIAVMLYLLGLSYGAVTLMLKALGLWMGKTTVYEAVQAMAERVPGMKQSQLLDGYRTTALGADLTRVKCKGKWLPLGVTVDPLTGLTLRIDRLALERLYQRYQEAKSPHKGKAASVAYRLRNLFLDRWNLWPRLTCYRSWQDPTGRKLDGTNNATERAIGWHIKERYRTMRGYKREQSALNVSRLIAHCGNHVAQGLQLASLMP